MKSFYIAIDLGATNVRVAICEGHKIINKLAEETDRFHDSEGISNQLIRMIKEIIDSHKNDEIESIGIGSIGPVELDKGEIIRTPNLPFTHIPIVKPLSEAFKVPVDMLNDCRAAVLGEHALGAGIGLKNVVYVTISTGIGGGAIVDNHLLLGKDGNAAEIGHFTIDEESPLVCGCGRRGHWEAYCSGRNLPSYARLLLNEFKIENSSQAYLTPKGLFNAADAGDETAIKIVSKVGEINAIGFANVIDAYDPEIITVGGSIALNNSELILKPIRENVGTHAINRVPPIILTPLKDEAVLYGALILAEKSLDEEAYPNI